MTHRILSEIRDLLRTLVNINGGSLTKTKTVKPKPQPKKDKPFTIDDIANLWAKNCPHLPQPTRPLAKTIREDLRAALARGEKPEVWDARFASVAASDWLSGRSGPWRADLIWAVGPRNCAKIDAGRYENRNVPKLRRDAGPPEVRVGPSTPHVSQLGLEDTRTPEEVARCAEAARKMRERFAPFVGKEGKKE